MNWEANICPGCENSFRDTICITDKRPDNFLHLGLIKVLFPCARIVYSRRNPVDNCLSVYFQQLGGNLSYATDLEDTAHYYRQHERLMAHWSGCFGEDIFTVDYDELVNSPAPVLRQLLPFLGLEWDDRCLTFHETDSLVKTASVWQVRNEIHTDSAAAGATTLPSCKTFRRYYHKPDKPGTQFISRESREKRMTRLLPCIIFILLITTACDTPQEQPATLPEAEATDSAVVPGFSLNFGKSI